MAKATKAPKEPKVIKEAKSRGFKVFEGKDYDINIIVARHPEQQPNKFSDQLFVCYQVDKKWISKSFVCTSTPGNYWLNFPMQSGGCAVVKHDHQYRSAFKLGYHKGRYQCLVQAKRIPVWRDNDRNNLVDYGTLAESHSWGIHIHRANAKWIKKRIHKYLVNRYSAGCVVIPFGFEEFMDTIKLQQEHHPTWKTYSLTVIQWNWKG